MNLVFDDIRISGIAAAVSDNWSPITDFVEKGIDESTIKKFSAKTGVKGRYNAGEKQTTADFCFAAAREIIQKYSINKGEIGTLVFVTQHPDYKSPATACVLQYRLGLSEECLAFDVNLGCSGFTCGLAIAASLLHMGSKKYALLLCGDTSAKEFFVGRETKKTNAAKMLFGDCGTSALLEKDNACEKMYLMERTCGEGFRAIISPYTWFRHPQLPSDGLGDDRMDDIAVFNFSTEKATELLRESMKATGTNPEDYDCLALHQANHLILKRIAKFTGFPEDKVLISLDEFGNTSSASIPVSLVKRYGNDDLGKRLRVLMCGYGVGLSWSTVDCFIDTDKILPLIHTDEFFEDGY